MEPGPPRALVVLLLQSPSHETTSTLTSRTETRGQKKSSAACMTGALTLWSTAAWCEEESDSCTLVLASVPGAGGERVASHARVSQALPRTPWEATVDAFPPQASGSQWEAQAAGLHGECHLEAAAQGWP